MPRIDGVFQLLPGIYGEPDTTIKSVPYNSQLDDFVNEMNGARPITAGGTGATSASQARTNLGVPTGTSGAVLPFLNAANTWSGAQTYTGANVFQSTGNTAITIERMNNTVNALIAYKTTTGTTIAAGQAQNGVFGVGDLASMNTPWITASASVFVSNVNASFVGTVLAGGTVSIANTAPTLHLNDTSISNLAHMVRSFGDHLVLDADVNNVHASSQIQFRIDGTISAGILANGSIYSVASRYMFGDSNTNDSIEFSDIDNTYGVIADGTTGAATFIVGGIKTEGAIDGTQNAYQFDATNRRLARTTTGDVAQLAFYNGNGSVGTIRTNGTATTYAVSSDYRLKYDLVPLEGAGAFIDALKPYRGKWVADDSDFVGFIAHEFAEVSPSSVSGEKDAMLDIGVAWKEDEDGQVPDDVRYARSDVEIGDVPDGWQWEKTGERPDYQSMQASTSEVMANVIAELQSLRFRVGVLEQ